MWVCHLPLYQRSIFSLVCSCVHVDVDVFDDLVIDVEIDNVVTIVVVVCFVMIEVFQWFKFLCSRL